MSAFMGSTVGSIVGSIAPLSGRELTAYVRDAAGPRRFSLSELRGRWVALFFYPRDFSPVSGAELASLAVLDRQLAAEGAAVVASSPDDYESHRAWLEGEAGLAEASFPIVADVERALARAFGVLLEDGTPLRGTVLIDPHGIVTQCIVDRGTGMPGIDAAVCAQVQARFRYRPALSASGRPVAGNPRC